MTDAVIYKITPREAWLSAKAEGVFKGAPVDLADGYIHFSTAPQSIGTAAKYFADMDGLVIAAMNADDLGDALKWEVSRGGDKFPHLYAPLRRADVIWHAPLPFVNGAHIFPKAM